MVSELVPWLENNIYGRRADLNGKFSIATLACGSVASIFGLLLKCARAHSRMRVFHVLSGRQTFMFIEWPGPLPFRDRIIPISVWGTLLMTVGSQRLCSAESIYQPFHPTRQNFGNHVKA